mmetsp:Transcript_18570/g.40891  ORF Transcript_18570/g.40891 Transcript_18570/m.40891 type:complete len:352 (+) Transcript_18570:706-1761(+)
MATPRDLTPETFLASAMDIQTAAPTTAAQSSTTTRVSKIPQAGKPVDSARSAAGPFTTSGRASGGRPRGGWTTGTVLSRGSSVHGPLGQLCWTYSPALTVAAAAVPVCMATPLLTRGHATLAAAACSMKQPYTSEYCQYWHMRKERHDFLHAFAPSCQSLKVVTSKIFVRLLIFMFMVFIKTLKPPCMISWARIGSRPSLGSKQFSPTRPCQHFGTPLVLFSNAQTPQSGLWKHRDWHVSSGLSLTSISPLHLPGQPVTVSSKTTAVLFPQVAGKPFSFRGQHWRLVGCSWPGQAARDSSGVLPGKPAPGMAEQAGLSSAQTAGPETTPGDADSWRTASLPPSQHIWSVWK